MTAWADAYRKAYHRARHADEAMRQAKALRCRELDSAGAQCTADAEPEHEHRYLDDDLPGYDPDLY